MWISKPGGRGGKRFRKTLPTKGEAPAYEAWLRSTVREEPAWAPAVKDPRRLGDLVEVLFSNHGVICAMVLQRILGHSSLAMTMRHTHLAPDHLQEARALNPLAALTVG